MSLGTKRKINKAQLKVGDVVYWMPKKNRVFFLKGRVNWYSYSKEAPPILGVHPHYPTGFLHSRREAYSADYSKIFVHKPLRVKITKLSTAVRKDGYRYNFSYKLVSFKILPNKNPLNTAEEVFRSYYSFSKEIYRRKASLVTAGKAFMKGHILWNGV